MPVLDFINEQENQTISVFVKITEPIENFQKQTVDGKIYKRIYSAPLAAKDTKRGDMTNEDYHRVTTDKKLKIGDMWDISKEMSQARAEKNGGKDPVKERFYSDYERKIGRKHHDVTKREARERLQKEMGIKIED